eukprot:COSAG02_NODE_489_length_21246_cov_49.035702_10_plen_111_part_00
MRTLLVPEYMRVRRAPEASGARLKNVDDVLHTRSNSVWPLVTRCVGAPSVPGCVQASAGAPRLALSEAACVSSAPAVSAGVPGRGIVARREVRARYRRVVHAYAWVPVAR